MNAPRGGVSALLVLVLVALNIIDVGNGVLDGLARLAGWFRDLTNVDLTQAPSVLTLVGIAAVLIIVVSAFHLRRYFGSPKEMGANAGNGEAGHASDADRQIRQRYLAHLKDEVENRLQASIHGSLLLDISMGETKGASVPWTFQAASTGGSKEFATFEQAFKHYDGQVLLFGHPGSGKSTTMLHLARHLIDTALEDPKAAVPILENLSRFQHLAIRKQASSFVSKRRKADPMRDDPDDGHRTDFGIQRHVANLVAMSSS